MSDLRIIAGRFAFQARFIAITSALHDLPKVGKLVLWEGAQALRIEAA